MILQLKAFFFNAKTDYLPYYKNFKIDIDSSEPISAVLPLIKEANRDFNYPADNLYFRVNSLVTDGKVSIVEVVEKLGSELTIEPLSKYRSVNGLEINDDDFMQSFSLLEEYCNDEDRDYYNRLYGLHYASSTFEYNKQYIGDAVIVLASRLIFNKHPKQDEILERITDDNGLWDAEYENGMFNAENYNDTFDLLKKLAKSPKNKNRVSGFLTRKYKDRDLKELDGIGIAFYYGVNSDEIFELSNNAISKGYFEVNYEHSNKSCGINLLETNEELALKKAARVLADAYDSGANLLLADKKYIDYFKNSFGKIEKVANRDILINLEDIDSFAP